ncbi:helix-turn-helix domain-containing protein [Bradyrhizobium sp. CCBAU 11386]|uniref:helix-turn-helix domain-containing protein n=1 Tax=Bradyrhizobium sp. CCBAU 11386 TaxID=1630837 RepID=UPI003FA4911E
MRHVRDVIRLRSAGMATREIARRVGTAPSTVRLTIRRFEATGLSWPLPDDVTDAVLEARLFASAGAGLVARPNFGPARTRVLRLSSRWRAGGAGVIVRQNQGSTADRPRRGPR